jgi:hypothetical protein
MNAYTKPPKRGERTPLAEEQKRFFWRNYGMIALQIDDPAISWDIREILQQFMQRRYGEYRPSGNSREGQS